MKEPVGADAQPEPLPEPALLTPLQRTGGGRFRKHVARGLAWTIVDVWGRQVLNLAVFVILANLLFPADFGLVALAAVFVSLAQVVADQGLGSAIIQRANLTRQHVDTAFWTAVATGLGLALLGLVTAPVVASLLNEPDLAPILRVLSLTYALSGMNTIQISLLRRQLAFRGLAIRTLISVTSGGIVGIALALAGFGPWALVGQQVTAAVVSVITLWQVLGWRPSLRFSRGHFRDLYGFSVKVVASDLLAFVGRNTDNLLIGAVLGTTPLGLYAVGYRILDTTQQLLISITRKVTFPALSALQHDPSRMRRAYYRVSRASSMIVMPAYIGLALIAQELTVLVFGAKWSASGAVASVLFLSGPVLSLQALSSPLFYTAGHPGVYLRFQLISTITIVIAFLVTVPFGILAVAAAFTARGYLLLPLNLHWARRYAGISITEYASQLRGILLSTAVMAAAVLALKLTLPGDLANLPRVTAEITMGGVAFVAALWVADRAVLAELFTIVAEALPWRGRRRDASREGAASAPQHKSGEER